VAKALNLGAASNVDGLIALTGVNNSFSAQCCAERSSRSVAA